MMNRVKDQPPAKDRTGESKKVYLEKSHLFSLLLIAVLLISSWSSACTNDGPSPFRLPFAVHKAGTMVETKVRITEHRPYIFSLCFNFKKDDQVDRARVKKLTGDPWPHKHRDTGIPTPLRLKISVIEPAGERLLVDKEISELKFNSFGASFFRKEIDQVELEPGQYRISVESLSNVPELADVKVVFSIGHDKKSSPISKK